MSSFLTSAALPANTYTAGTPGASVDTITMSANGALSVDGQLVANGDQIYVKDESTSSHNGIFQVSVAGDGTHQAVLTRNGASAVGVDLFFIVGNINLFTRWTISSTIVLNQNCYVSGTFSMKCFTTGATKPSTSSPNSATGPDSSAIGAGNTASGDSSAAFGSFCQATATGAIAIGYNVTNSSVTSAEIGSGLHKFHVGESYIDLARGAIDGFVLSNHGTSPNTKIVIASGTCSDSSASLIMTDNNGMTKDISAAWAAGGNNGGMFTGAVAASTVYHVFAIFNGTDGSIDYGFDTSVTASHIPAGYAAYRRLGSVITDGASHIKAFHQYGDKFYWDTSILDVNVTNPGVAAVTRTLTVPTGVKVEAIFTSVSWDSTQNTQHYVSSLDATDEAPSYANAIEVGSSNTTNEAVTCNRIFTNTSGQVRSRLAQSGANTAFKIRTRGWVDTRGKNA